MRSLHFSNWVFVVVAVIVGLGVVAIPAVEAGQKVSPAPQGLTLVDSSGKVIGPLYPAMFSGTSSNPSGDNETVAVFDPNYGVYVLAEVRRTGFVGGIGGLNFFYAQPDCQGETLLAYSGGSLYKLVVPLFAVEEDLTGYYMDQSTYAERTIQSNRERISSTCENMIPHTEWTAVARIIHLDALYTPPFSIK